MYNSMHCMASSNVYSCVQPLSSSLETDSDEWDSEEEEDGIADQSPLDVTWYLMLSDSVHTADQRGLLPTKNY